MLDRLVLTQVQKVNREIVHEITLQVSKLNLHLITPSSTNIDIYMYAHLWSPCVIAMWVFVGTHFFYKNGDIFLTSVLLTFQKNESGIVLICFNTY